MTSLAAMVVLSDGDGRALLVRQGYGKGLWALPGGEVEINEAPWNAATREAREEVGVAVEIDAFVALYHLPAPRPGLRFVFAGRTADTPEPQSEEIVEIGWFTPEMLPVATHASVPFAVRDAMDGARGITREILR